MSKNRPRKSGLGATLGYLVKMAVAIGLFTVGGVMVISALLGFLLFAGALMVCGKTSGLLPILLASALISLAIGVGGVFLIRAGRKIEAIEPDTESNAHLLPAEETLLRGGTDPSLDRSVELVRPAEEPQVDSNEMLRAVVDGGSDSVE